MDIEEEEFIIAKTKTNEEEDATTKRETGWSWERKKAS